jgi:hypothetical protein
LIFGEHYQLFVKEIDLLLVKPVVLILDLVGCHLGILQQLIYIDVIIVPFDEPDKAGDNPAVV